MKTKTAIIIALIIILMSLLVVLRYKHKKETKLDYEGNVRYVNENLNEIVNRERSNETIELFLEE